MDHSSGIWNFGGEIQAIGFKVMNIYLPRRPGFRESAFQPFKREEKSEAGRVEEEKLEVKQEAAVRETEEEDSETDEMVDIERIEDKEEDGQATPLVNKQCQVEFN